MTDYSHLVKKVDLTKLKPYGDIMDDAAAWSEVVAGDWLAQTLRGLREPEGLAQVDPGTALRTD